MDMDTNGFYGDTFNNGFGSFETVKRAAGHGQSKPLYRCESLIVFFRLFYFLKISKLHAQF